MGFQQQVYKVQPPGLIGTKATTNPVRNVFAGPGALTAASGGARVGGFCWVNSTNGQASNASPGGLVQPDGFLANQLQGQVTIWLAESSLLVPAGSGLTLYDRGDFWAQTPIQAAKGQKVFANLVDGTWRPGAAGATLTNAIGVNAAVTGNLTAGDNTLNITAVASGTIAVGQKVTGPGLTNAYIYQLGSSTGGTGTVYLTQNASAAVTGGSYGLSDLESAGGWVGTASFATNVMTVVTTTSGKPVAGAVVTSASVTAGTYITKDNGDGTYNLSTSPGTITTQAASDTVWIETPFSVESNGNAGDLVAIGVKN